MKKTLLGFMTVLALYLCLGMTVCAAPKAKTTAKTTAKKTAAAPAPVAVGSAKILDGATVAYTANVTSVPASDDGVFYLYELAPYQYSVPAGAQPIATAPVSANPTFTFALNHKQANTRLYSKFALVVNKGGVPNMVANPQYITNPEVLATHTKPRTTKVKNTQLNDFTNLYLDGNCKVTYPIFRTAQLMCDGRNQALTNPYARLGVPDAAPIPYEAGYRDPRGAKDCYMLNANDAQGVSMLANEISFYAANSNAENFIVGNEVNVRSWNYMTWQGWDEYMRQYEQVFRVAYNAIKSENANANVFTCIDQNWDRNRAADATQCMDGIDFLTKFNAEMAASGNIDWGLSQHPWPVPLTYAKFWDMSGTANGGYMAAQVNTNKMLSFQNLGALTGFMCQPAMLSPTGAVRHIILSECGVTANQGSDVQAAALYASFQAVLRNPYLEEIYYIAAPEAINTGFTPQTQQIFNNMDTPNAAASDAWAKAYIGISDWGQILH